MSLRRAWTQHRTFILLLMACLVLHLAWILYTGYIDEDAFITFRFARNLAQGQGFVYNPGEAVYGTTTPLFTFLMSIWLLVARDPVPGALLISLLATLGSVILTFRALEEEGLSPAQRSAAILMLIVSPRLLYLDSAGMEGTLAIAIMAASWLAYRRERWVATGVLLGVLLWVRLDTALWVLILVAGACLKKPTHGGLVALAAGITYLPWVVYAWRMFGSPVPLTVTAKYWAYFIQGKTVAAPFLEPPLSMLLNRLEPIFHVLERMNPFGTRSPIAPWSALSTIISTLLAMSAIFYAWKNRILRELTLFSLLETARLLVLRQTFFDRYFMPVIWANSILIGFWVGSIVERRSGLFSRRGAWVLIPVLILIMTTAAIGRNAHNLRQLQQVRNEASLRSIGLWLRQNTSPHTTVQLEPLGYIGYYSNRIMLDEVGLVTPQVIELKKRGITQPLSMIPYLSPDALVIHCDDAMRIEEEAEWQVENLGHEYHFAVRFDPLHFRTDQGLLEADQPLARASCYEVWQTVP